MRYVIISGANRGLGDALVERFKEDYVITVTRSTPDNKNIKANFTVNLTNEMELEEEMEKLFKSINPKSDDEVLMINNAGTLRPVMRVEDIESDKVLDNYKVNVLAPMVMTKTMINALKDVECEKKIVNISSGAAVNPVSGWSAYCSAKAGLNMLSEVVHLEQKDVPQGVKSVTFRPGVIDTDMQQEIRSSDAKDFKDVERFKDLKKNNELLKADDVANAIYKLVSSEDFGKDNHYAVQDYL